MEMNKELLEKAKNAKSAEELLALAHENGLADFTEENAKSYFEQLHKSGELSDDELDNVAGGGCGEPEVNPHPKHDWDDDCEHQEDVSWDSMWNGSCLMCRYSSDEDDANETIRCYYPTKVRKF